MPAVQLVRDPKNGITKPLVESAARLLTVIVHQT
jgi:hypothetical protein